MLQNIGTYDDISRIRMFGKLFDTRIILDYLEALKWRKHLFECPLTTAVIKQGKTISVFFKQLSSKERNLSGVFVPRRAVLKPLLYPRLSFSVIVCVVCMDQVPSEEDVMACPSLLQSCPQEHLTWELVLVS